jgi:hypothetical protein
VAGTRNRSGGVLACSGRSQEVEEVDEARAADGGEYVDLIVHLGAARGGALDGAEGRTAL